MSIYVSISRRAEPLEDDGPQITAEEWLEVVSSESDFRLPQGAEGEWVGPHARVWTGHPQVRMSFDWVDGQVDVKNPDAATIARMKALAARLQATVFSETGELFDDAGESAGFLDGYP